MPSLSNVFWTSLPLLIAAVIYQTGVPAFILQPFTNNIVFKIIQNIFSTTHCYVSVTTLSGRTPHAECFSVSEGKFSRVFLDDTSYDVTKEARTGHVIPGLWDGHGHLLRYGESLDSVDLFGAKSIEEAQSRLESYKIGHPEAGSSEQWLRGIGWDQAHFKGQWPTSADLEISSSFKDLYIMLDRVDVHCVWVSEKVLSLLPKLPAHVPGGETPAKGVFCDNAIDIVTKYYPAPNAERKTKFVKDAMFQLNKVGIVGIHDAGVSPETLKMYEQLSTHEDWTVRVNAMVECDVRNSFCPEAVEKVSTPNGMFHVKSVKLFADGALGSWGSAMIEPYNDKVTSSGSLLVNATTLSKLTLDWSTAGYQVNIHAIGDLANRLAIDAFQAALRTLCPETDLSTCQAAKRFRIEHAQIIHTEDQRRMKEMGIIPSIQPTHATSDVGYAETRLGKQRTQEEAYRMRSLLPLNPILGSDFPVEPANPFKGMYAALTRRNPRTGLDHEGKKVGWYADETITLEEALEGFTINPAYGAFLEGKAGVIEAGAYADWIVLDEPLEALDSESLRKVTVRETWVAGKRVYRRSGAEGLPWNSGNRK